MNLNVQHTVDHVTANAMINSDWRLEGDVLTFIALLGIEPPSQPAPKPWKGVSERVYYDDNVDALEIYSEWWLILDCWHQKCDTN
jgi:hypothetical protein